MPSLAAPYTPDRDDEVLTTLPQRTGPSAAAERLARAQLRAAPDNLPLALALARDALTQARLSGDPRELGQAQAALAPWWDMPQPPAAVQLLRASVRQSLHDFKAALADLDALLSQGSALTLPLRAQALLSRAGVHQVQGRHAAAAQDCVRLQSPEFAPLGAGVSWTGKVCQAELRSLQGEADEARRALQALAREAPADQAAWLTLVRAELADRLQDPRAGGLFASAATQLGDVYSLGAYADWLLAHGRAADVPPLLAGREEADALLLRLALAYRYTGDARLEDAARQLQGRFADALARGDTSHARERARFALGILDDVPTALRLATQNWASQKEPADARLLIDTARAAGQPDAAREALQASRPWASAQAAGTARQVAQATPHAAEPTRQEP